jgi:ketosteroid isomerase-like protein
MFRIAALLAIVFVSSQCVYAQRPCRDGIPRDYQPNCYIPTNPEMAHEEIVNIEGETARAILLNNATFFHRVYSDDFVGTLSHGQPVDRAALIAVVQSSDVKYQAFIATDVKVRIYQDLAVATCLWTARGVYRGRQFNTQIRVTHVYVNTLQGWHVISAQHTALPPNVEQPL